MLTAGVARLGALDSVIDEPRGSELCVLALYGYGDLGSLAAAFGDVPGAEVTAVLADQIELTAREGQRMLPRLIELASCCDVELLAVAVLPSRRRALHAATVGDLARGASAQLGMV